MIMVRTYEELKIFSNKLCENLSLKKCQCYTLNNKSL